MQLEAKLIEILPQQSGSGRNGEWRKQEFVFNTLDQFSRKVCISFWTEKIPQDLQIGQIYLVDFDIESREYNSKWYTDLRAWKITTLSNDNFQINNQETISSDVFQGEEENDLPF